MLKIVIDKSKLIEPLSNVIGVTERKSLMPYLSNVMVRFGQESMIYGTDLEISAIAKIDYKTDREEKSIVVNARKLYDVLRELDKGTVTMEIGENKLALSQENIEFVLALYDPEEFPEARKVGSDIEFYIQGKELLDMFESVAFAMGSDEERYVLTGVLMKGTGDSLTVVATDGYRMALKMNRMPDVPFFSGSIVPSKTVRELEKVIGSDDRVHVQMDKGGICFETEKVRITSRLIEGQYPDYEAAIPRHNTSVFKVERGAFYRGLKRVSAIMTKSEPVLLRVSEGNLEIWTESEQGTAKEFIRVDYRGEKKELNFNVRFLMDALSHTKGDLIRMSLPESYGAVLIEDEGNDYLNVIMPIKV